MYDRRWSTPPELQTRPLSRLQRLRQGLQDLGVRPDWDILICGDGSGVGWERPCGWASLLIEASTDECYEFFGAWSQGTVTLAELMPVLHALTWHAAERLHRSVGERRPCVAVLTDSQMVARTGQALADPEKRPPRKHRGFWESLQVLGQEDYRIRWHWLPRDSTDLNRYTDALSHEAMHSMKRVRRPESIVTTGTVCRGTQEVTMQRTREATPLYALGCSALQPVRFKGPADDACG